MRRIAVAFLFFLLTPPSITMALSEESSPVTSRLLSSCGAEHAEIEIRRHKNGKKTYFFKNVSVTEELNTFVETILMPSSVSFISCQDTQGYIRHHFRIIKIPNVVLQSHTPVKVDVSSGYITFHEDKPLNYATFNHISAVGGEIFYVGVPSHIDFVEFTVD